MKCIITYILMIIALSGCRTVPKWWVSPEERQSSPKEIPPLTVLETFLGDLATGQFESAYVLVAPSSKKYGDPIASNTPLDYVSFLDELQGPISHSLGEQEEQELGDLRDKFKGYKISKSRWENKHRYRVWVTFQEWDRDEALVVYEDGAWYVADPIHLIR